MASPFRPKFHPLQVSQSPITSSPNKNLTGSARTVRDLIVDLYNNIQKWNSYHIDGGAIVKQITSIKTDDFNKFSSELEEYSEKLYVLIQSMSTCVERLQTLKSQLSAIQKITEAQEILFFSLKIGSIVNLFASVVDEYSAEFKVKQMVLEHIAHSKNKDEVMFFLASWIYQPKITSEINSQFEALLVETGLRGIE